MPIRRCSPIEYFENLGFHSEDLTSGMHEFPICCGLVMVELLYFISLTSFL